MWIIFQWRGKTSGLLFLFLTTEPNQDLQQNPELVYQHVGESKEDGARRVRETKTNCTKGFIPEFTNKAHTFVSVERADVIVQNWSVFTTNHVQTVPTTLQDANVSRFTGGAVAKRDTEHLILHINANSK